MELWNASLFFMNILKIKNKRAVKHSPFLKKIATYQWVSEWVSQSVSEKAKLIRGDPPKIDFKKKGEPPKKWQFSIKFTIYV